MADILKLNLYIAGVTDAANPGAADKRYFREGSMATTISSDGLEPRRKKALYHAWHRGTKEMDILLGEFADARIASLSEADLADLEALMQETDRDLFSWIIGSESTPDARQTAVWAELVAFHQGKYQPVA